jgi:hypothetical protein
MPVLPHRTQAAQELQQLVEQQQRELQGGAAARGEAQQRATQQVPKRDVSSGKDVHAVSPAMEQ